MPHRAWLLPGGFFLVCRQKRTFSCAFLPAWQFSALCLPCDAQDAAAVADKVLEKKHPPPQVKSTNPA
jgi:hypothetical protein